MKIQPKPITYGVYVRKSTESEDRQVQSLVRQIGDLKNVIEREDLIVHSEIFKESQSAFQIGRPVFKELVEMTMRGEINSWLCWHPNRLSRNPLDAGMIIHLMDQGKLHHIRTCDRIYSRTPQDKLMLQIEFGMSKNDSEEKSIIVKSGIRRRAERGYPTSFPPIGFTLSKRQINSGTSVWEADEQSLKKVRLLFDRYLEGNDSVLTLSYYAKELGLKSVKRRLLGGRSPSTSTIHKILHNTIFAGYFYSLEGERYELAPNLPRVVTEEEYEKIQILLGSRRTSVAKYHDTFPFRSLIKSPQGEVLCVDTIFHLICDCGHKFSYLLRTNCPKCNAVIEKLRSPRYRNYRYYFSRNVRLKKTRWFRAIEEKKVSALLADHIKKEIIIAQGFTKWARDFIAELQDTELNNFKRETKERDQIIKSLTSKRAKLRELYLDELISKREFQDEIEILDHNFENVNQPDFTVSKDWSSEIGKIGDLATELLLLLKHGTGSEINAALKSIGISMTWDGENLTFRHSPLLRKVISLSQRAHKLRDSSPTLDTVMKGTSSNEERL